ncbi:hypothetical protein NQ176_g7400 [Zarea fungicola]|uniref:Uncharacterized protein n=1 Tax=Zarea fungicola TaxID=93591 RepID=A0ACC1MYE6_9HYPO|nr:hypothetical protein NQ176_g7400 [Lecanicillium fungicola]
MTTSRRYTFDASLAGLDISKAAYLAANPHVARLMAAAMVFRQPNSTATSTSASAAQTLLLCRAFGDSYPMKWEISGGSVDAGDSSILDAIARELWEETGLVVRHMSSPVLIVPAEGEARYALSDDMRCGLGIKPDEEDVGINADGLSVTFLETGEIWAKPTAIVEVDTTDGVVLREDEHVDWAWATEEDVLKGEVVGQDGCRKRMDFKEKKRGI